MQDLLNDYVCVCVAGWEGKDCSIETNECNPNPCVNGATCVVSNRYSNNINDTKLQLLSNLHASSNIFQDHFDDYFCSCQPGYSGRNCEVDIDECLPRPCENGGTCTDLVNGYRCDCGSEFMVRNYSSQ